MPPRRRGGAGEPPHREGRAELDIGWQLQRVRRELLHRETKPILRHAQIEVTMNVYTEVSDAKTLRALKRLARQLTT
jgi:hypothetical protein